jgi:hypothetical protein
MRKLLLLATPDSDLGLVPADQAKRRAKEAANETDQPISVRDPLTDEVLATSRPRPV